jgi:uncharacterized phiE125 gp8 family phage protein
MGLKVITPASDVLTLAQLRLHLRLISDPHPEDALLLANLAAAVQYCEHYTGRSIGEQTLELALDAFPSGPIELKQGPAISIESIKYLDSAGIEQTLSASAYTLDDYGLQHWAIAAGEWPDTGGYANAVKVRYVAGNLPPAVQSALLLTVSDLYENRDQAELSRGACALLDTVKVYG